MVGAWTWPLSYILCRCYECVEPHLHSPIRHHGVVLTCRVKFTFILHETSFLWNEPGITWAMGSLQAIDLLLLYDHMSCTVQWTTREWKRLLQYVGVNSLAGNGCVVNTERNGQVCRWADSHSKTMRAQISTQLYHTLDLLSSIARRGCPAGILLT